MFKGQKVFCRTESVFKLESIAEIYKDTVRLLDGTTVNHNSIIPSLSTKMCEISNHKTNISAKFIQPGLFLHHENSSIRIIRPNNTTIVTFHNVEDIYDSYAVDLSRKKLFVYDKISNNIIIMPFNKSPPSTHHLQFEVVYQWRIIYKTPYVLYWSSSRCSILNTEDNTISPLIKQTERISEAKSSSLGDVCLIGDHKGYINIWYTSNWDRHHHIHIASTPIIDIDLNSDKKAVICSKTSVAVLDIVSGILLFNRDCKIEHACILDYIIFC